MKMELEFFITIFGCLVTIQGQDISKIMKKIPSISSSLVNLGKMDIAFYLNTKGKSKYLVHEHDDLSMKPDSYLGSSNSFLFSKSEPVQEPCPCSSLRNFKETFVSNPSDILSKILISNDLFSNRELMTSTHCCESHEHSELTFELNPRQTYKNFFQPNLLQTAVPSIFEKLLPRKTLMSAPKPKALEIFLFPKKKESLYLPMTKDLFKKNSTQTAGDEELKHGFKTMMYKPSLSMVNSVKKDLTAQEKQETEKPNEKVEESQVSLSPSLNAIIGNN